MPRRKPGRPRLAQRPIEIRLTLRLYEGADDDLIAFFRRVPPGFRPAAVRQALRQGTLDTQAGDLPGDDSAAAALDQLLL